MVNRMKNIAVFCSGFGSNLQAILNAVQRGRIAARINLVLSDRVDAYALVRARRAGVAYLFIDPRGYAGRTAYDRAIIKELKKRQIDYVILAGYMRLLSPQFVRAYRNRILNIHPALLPSFKGTQGIRDALQYGVKVTGVTAHLVDENLDNGPIVLQQAVRVLPDDTQESLAQRIHRAEHRVYPQAIQLLVTGKLVIRGRTVAPRE